MPISHSSLQEQARVLIGKLPEGADVFEAVEQRCPELIGTEVILVCRSKLSSQEQVCVSALLGVLIANVFVIAGFHSLERASCRRGAAECTARIATPRYSGAVSLASGFIVVVVIISNININFDNNFDPATCICAEWL